MESGCRGRRGGCGLKEDGRYDMRDEEKSEWIVDVQGEMEGVGRRKI